MFFPTLFEFSLRIRKKGFLIFTHLKVFVKSAWFCTAYALFRKHCALTFNRYKYMYQGIFDLNYSRMHACLFWNINFDLYKLISYKPFIKISSERIAFSFYVKSHIQINELSNYIRKMLWDCYCEIHYRSVEIINVQMLTEKKKYSYFLFCRIEQQFFVVVFFSLKNRSAF